MRFTSGRFTSRAVHRLFCLAAAAGFLACPAAAATLSEADVGMFSHDWSSPSIISGVSGVTGTTGDGYDMFRFDLPAGPRELTISFSAGSRMGYSYSAGSTLMYSLTGFPWGWSGATLGTVQIDWNQQADRLLHLSLDKAFEGTLYLALYNTHGAMDYAINGLMAPTAGRGQAEVPAAVPLPAGLALLGSVLGAGGLFALRRRRDAAAS